MKKNKQNFIVLVLKDNVQISKRKIGTRHKQGRISTLLDTLNLLADEEDNYLVCW